MDLFGKKEENPPQGAPQQGAEPPKEAGHGLGSLLHSDKGAAPAADAGGVNPQNLAKDMNSVSRRVRINEERAMNIRKKSQMIEHNMLGNHKKILGEIKFINEEIAEVRRDFDELKQKVMGFAHELQQTAKKEDVNVIERYIQMWEPVNFVTRKEVERIIDEILRAKKG